MSQNFTSANTSINRDKLPALFHHIDLSKCMLQCCGAVLDYGCGKYTDHIQKFFADRWCAPYVGCDKFNQSAEVNAEALRAIHSGECDIFTCANVLNVIDDDETIQSIVDGILTWIENYSCCGDGSFFFSVYEGDGSGIGRQTGADQYQRNEKAKAYLRFFPKGTVVRYGIITNNPKAVVKELPKDEDEEG